jgi:hypothetical protein
MISQKSTRQEGPRRQGPDGGPAWRARSNRIMRLASVSSGSRLGPVWTGQGILVTGRAGVTAFRWG